MVFENEVKNIQAAAYNGARTLVALIHNHTYNLRIFHGVHLNFVIDKYIFNFMRIHIGKVDFHAR